MQLHCSDTSGLLDADNPAIETKCRHSFHLACIYEVRCIAVCAWRFVHMEP